MIQRNLTERPALQALAAILTGAVLSLSAPSIVHGQVEVEADPIAYALSGYSGHLAYRMDSYRVSLGVFAANVPEFVHGNDGWDFRTSGATAKFDYLFSGLNGPFVGIDTGYQKNHHDLPAADASASRDGFSAGLRTGYRVPLGGSGLYVVPWVSVNYQFERDDVHLNGETFNGSRLFIFPTVHVGWRFGSRER